LLSCQAHHHEHRFIISGEELYKVGRTGDLMRHLQQNSKGDILECAILVNAEKLIEAQKIVLYTLRETFTPRTDIGRNYFAGDIDCMIQTIYDILRNL